MGCQTGFVETSQWIQANAPDSKPMREMSVPDLVNLARKAHTSQAPTSVFKVIQDEIALRSSTTTRPVRELSPAAVSPDVIQKKVTAGASQRFKREVELVLNGRANKDRPTGMALQLQKVTNFINTQRSSWKQVSESGFGGFIGPHATWEDVFQTLSDPKARAGLESAVKASTEGAEAARGEVLRMVQVGIRDVEQAAKAYQMELKAQGIKKKIGEVYEELYNTYQGGAEAHAAVTSPAAKAALDVAKKTQNELSMLVRGKVSDPEVIATIDRNMGRYLHRQYMVFKDPEAVFKRIDQSSDAYQAIKKATAEDIRKELNDTHLHELRDQHPEMSEIEINDLMDQIVDNRIEASTNARVKKLLSSENERSPLRGAIRTPKWDALKDRLLYDKNLRQIMGEQAHLPMAISELGSDVAFDIYAATLRNSLYDSFKKYGLISDNGPIAGLESALNKTTLVPPVEALDDAADGVIYTSPEIASTLQALDKSLTGSGAAMTRMVGYLKMAKVVTPLGALFNSISSVGNAILASGLGRTSVRLVSFGLQKEMVAAFQLGKEIAFPGSTGVDNSSIKSALNILGFKDTKEAREFADEFVKYGLDVGGEYHAMGQEGLAPLIKEGKAPGVVKQGLKKTSSAILESYRSPDIMAKVYTYRSLLDEIQYKNGVKGLTTEDKKLAAKMTLELSQDPRSTPHAIRNLSRGVTGLALGGFQGFHYQMGKTLANSVRYGIKDLIASATYMSEGNAAKAGRYFASASDRLVSTVGVGYMMYKSAEAAFGKDPEKIPSIKHFLYENRRNSALLNMGTDKGKDGKKYLTTFDYGLTDPYDSSVQRILAPFITKMAKGQPLEAAKAVAKESADLMIGAGLAAQMMADAFGQRLSGFPYQLTDKRDSDKGQLTISNAVDTAKNNLIPKAFQQVGESVASSYQMDTASDPDMYEKSKSNLLKQFRIDRQPVDQMVSRRFNEDWKKGTWISDARKQWKDAKGIDAKARLIKTYEKQWDSLYNDLLTTSHKAHDAFDLTNIEVYNYIAGKKGEDAPTSIPKGLAKKLALGKVVTFRSFLDE